MKIESELLAKVYDYSVCWQMSPHERVACLSIIDEALFVGHIWGDQELSAMEIGTFCGGLLRHLHENFSKVKCYDVDFGNLSHDLRQSEDIEFIQGDSRVTLQNAFVDPKFQPRFILIDANHEYEFVKSDLANVMKYVPGQVSYLLIHDSWYPPSRRAILECAWSPYVHFVDVDFCSGTVLENGTCVGGLCLVILGPEPRTGDLEIRQSDVRAYNKLSR